MFLISNRLNNNSILLNYIATKSNGRFIDASKEKNIDKIIEKIEKPVLKFLCSDFDDEIEEVYPNEPVILEDGKNFNLFGKISENLKNNILKIGISFSFDSFTISKEFEIKFEKKKINNQVIEYLWANEKINSLMVFPDLFKDEIKEISKK
jgi:hypothetical protein